jgi:hypothetical protein
VGHGEEDAVDLGQFFFEEADELVVELDGFERLKIDGLAGGAGAVDDALDAALELRFDGDNEALATDGDEVFLRGAAFRELAQGGAQRVFDSPLLALGLAADAAEFCGGVVCEGAVGEHLAAQAFCEWAEVGGEHGVGEGVELGKPSGERGRGLAKDGGPAADLVGKIEDGPDFFKLECGAFEAGFGECVGRVEERAEGGADPFVEEEAHFVDS